VLLSFFGCAASALEQGERRLERFRPGEEAHVVEGVNDRTLNVRHHFDIDTVLGSTLVTYTLLFSGKTLPTWMLLELRHATFRSTIMYLAWKVPTMGR
jgi:hypothetical protein